MHVKRVKETPTELTINISATAEDLEPIKQQVLKVLAKKVKAPGFREGKVPAQVAEKYIDTETMTTNFLDEAMTQLYAKATESEGIRPVTQPKVDLKKYVPYSTLEYEVTTGVIGPVSLGNYKGLKATAKAKKITDSDVTKVLDSLRDRLAERKPADRPAKKGDEVVIDFKGTDAKDEPISGADGKDYPLILGSDSFIPGFEDNIVGMKAGDSKTFDITFPGEYGVSALAGKKAKFSIDVKTVNEMIKPELNDDIAPKVGPFKTLDELKKDIRTQVEHESQQEFVRAQQNELIDQVYKNSKVEVPEQLVEQQMVYETDNLRQNLAYRGQTYEEFLESEGKTDDEYKKEVIRPNAERQVKTGIYLSEIASSEGLTVNNEELDAQMQALNAQYTDAQMREQLAKPEARQDIASRILAQKVVDFIASQAK